MLCTFNIIRTHRNTLNAARDTLLRHSSATRIVICLMALFLMALGTVSQATATNLAGSPETVHHCTTRYSDELENTSPTGAVFIAVTPFKLSCRGDITGSLDVITGRISHTYLLIEKEDNGTWRRVERGNYIYHQAEPGTYRLTVEQTGKRGGYTSWQLRYSKPLP